MEGPEPRNANSASSRIRQLISWPKNLPMRSPLFAWTRKSRWIIFPITYSSRPQMKTWTYLASSLESRLRTDVCIPNISSHPKNFLVIMSLHLSFCLTELRTYNWNCHQHSTLYKLQVPQKWRWNLKHILCSKTTQGQHFKIAQANFHIQPQLAISFTGLLNPLSTP